MRRKYCPHERVSRYKRSENLVGLIVAFSGGTSPWKSALASEIAKALRCTFLEHHQYRSCFSAGDGSASSGDPSYRILWKMIDTHLDRRNHHVVLDCPLARRVELDRLLGIAESHDAVLILIVCEPRQRPHVQEDDGKGDAEAALARDLERSLSMEEEQVDDLLYDYDLGEIDIPKLVIGAPSGTELDEHIESVKKLILTSLDDKFTIVDGDDTGMEGCNRCALDAVRRRFASFPKTFKHELDSNKFHLSYRDDVMRKGSTFSYMCRACCYWGENLYYTWRELYFHPECVLELPLHANHKFHPHTLKLTLLPPKDDTDEYYCEVCAEERDADNWIYYCSKCKYEAHVLCVVPNLPSLRRKPS